MLNFAVDFTNLNYNLKILLKTNKKIQYFQWTMLKKSYTESKIYLENIQAFHDYGLSYYII